MRKKNAEDFNYYFGAMGSAKTANLLMSYFNCKNDNGMNVVILTPSVDDRAGVGIIKSRTGIQAPATIITNETNILELILELEDLPHMVMVDEIQFFLPKQIEELKELADNYQVVVNVYGLKNNFQGKLFGEETGTIKRVLELATNIFEIKSYCACGNSATNVARYNFENWEIQKEGPEIEIGGNDRYVALCHKCWNRDSIPRKTRIRLLSAVLEAEIKKETNADLEKIYNIRERINCENEKIFEEEIEALEKQTSAAKSLIKKLKSNQKKDR
ncbi:MAG: hypothetical protein WC917_05035 [Bacilli bacterium]|jgi:thymidine kinase